MKVLSAVIASLALALVPVSLYAITDERAPGIYTVMEGKSIPLGFTYASGSVSSKGEGYSEVGHNVFRYAGMTSGTSASHTFVVVIDPAQKETTRKMKDFDPFTKRLTPARIIIVPLDVIPEADCRMYDPGTNLSGINMEKMPRIEFEWTRISDNSYEISMYGKRPGEYGFVFSESKITGFDYSAIYGFTIPDERKNDNQK